MVKFIQSYDWITKHIWLISKHVIISKWVLLCTVQNIFMLKPRTVAHTLRSMPCCKPHVRWWWASERRRKRKPTTNQFFEKGSVRTYRNRIKRMILLHLEHLYPGSGCDFYQIYPWIVRHQRRVPQSSRYVDEHLGFRLHVVHVAHDRNAFGSVSFAVHVHDVGLLAVFVG